MTGEKSELRAWLRVVTKAAGRPTPVVTMRGGLVECGGAEEGFDDGAEGGVGEVGLEGEDEDGVDVLDDEDAEGESAGEGVELALVVEEFDDDGGAGEGAHDGEVESVGVVAGEAEA